MEADGAEVTFWQSAAVCLGLPASVQQSAAGGRLRGTMANRGAGVLRGF